MSDAAARASRLEPLDPPQSGTPLASFFATVAERRSAPLNLHLALAHAPRAGEAYVALAYALRFDVTLDRTLGELAIAVVALRRSHYEWRQHRPMALELGVTETQIAALEADDLRSGAFDERQRLVLAYADRMERGAAIDDAQFAQLRAHFPQREIVELTLTVALYLATASVANALDVRPET